MFSLKEDLQLLDAIKFRGKKSASQVFRALAGVMNRSVEALKTRHKVYLKVLTEIDKLQMYNKSKDVDSTKYCAVIQFDSIEGKKRLKDFVYNDTAGPGDESDIQDGVNANAVRRKNSRSRSRKRAAVAALKKSKKVEEEKKLEGNDEIKGVEVNPEVVEKEKKSIEEKNNDQKMAVEAQGEEREMVEEEPPAEEVAAPIKEKEPVVEIPLEENLQTVVQEQLKKENQENVDSQMAVEGAQDHLQAPLQDESPKKSQPPIGLDDLINSPLSQKKTKVTVVHKLNQSPLKVVFNPFKALSPEPKEPEPKYVEEDEEVAKALQEMKRNQELDDRTVTKTSQNPPKRKLDVDAFFKQRRIEQEEEEDGGMLERMIQSREQQALLENQEFEEEDQEDEQEEDEEEAESQEERQEGDLSPQDVHQDDTLDLDDICGSTSEKKPKKKSSMFSNLCSKNSDLEESSGNKEADSDGGIDREVEDIPNQPHTLQTHRQKVLKQKMNSDKVPEPSFAFFADSKPQGNLSGGNQQRARKAILPEGSRANIKSTPGFESVLDEEEFILQKKPTKRTRGNFNEDMKQMELKESRVDQIAAQIKSLTQGGQNEEELILASEVLYLTLKEMAIMFEVDLDTVIRGLRKQGGSESPLDLNLAKLKMKLCHDLIGRKINC